MSSPGTPCRYRWVSVGWPVTGRGAAPPAAGYLSLALCHCRRSAAPVKGGMILCPLPVIGEPDGLPLPAPGPLSGQSIMPSPLRGADPGAMTPARAARRRCTSWTLPTSGSRCGGPRPRRSGPSRRPAATAARARSAPGAASGTSGTARTGGPARCRRARANPRSERSPGDTEPAFLPWRRARHAEATRELPRVGRIAPHDAG